MTTTLDREIDAILDQLTGMTTQPTTAGDPNVNAEAARRLAAGEYREHAELHRKLGVGEQEYIDQRLRELGHLEPVDFMADAIERSKAQFG